MRVLISCQHFDYLSGAPMYVYELARVLYKRGHHVVIVTENPGSAGSPFINAIVGWPTGTGGSIRVCDASRPEEFNEPFDVLHLNQPGVSNRILRAVPGVPAIQTCHSEWSFEDPVLNSRIKKYVAIRPTIKDRLVGKFGIPEEKVEVVYNGVDTGRFNPFPIVNQESTFQFGLFVGTIDGLRKEAARQFADACTGNGLQCVFMGRKFDGWVDDLKREFGNVEWLPERWFTEGLLRNPRCLMTGGIMLGRTTIESLMCGKPSIIYDIDLGGRVKSSKVRLPSEDDREFDIELMTDKIGKIYGSILGENS